MIIPVHMMAFYNTKGVVRDVEIPEDQSNGIYAGQTEQLLELVFKYGQNDFQPKEFYSVSVGDVAQVGSQYFMCMSMGWKELTKNQFDRLEVPTCGICSKNNSFIFENA